MRTVAQSMARELGSKNIHVAHMFPERCALKHGDGILDPEAIAENCSGSRPGSRPALIAPGQFADRRRKALGFSSRRRRSVTRSSALHQSRPASHCRWRALQADGGRLSCRSQCLGDAGQELCEKIISIDYFDRLQGLGNGLDGTLPVAHLRHRRGDGHQGPCVRTY